jgi:hypothetical protein
MISPMTDHRRCMLAHDITNKLFAIIAHCDELELRIPSPWVFERTAKIKALAGEVSEILRSRDCPTEVTATTEAV